MQVLHGMSVVYTEKARLPLPCPYMTFSNIVNPHPALEEEHSYGASPIIFFSIVFIPLQEVQIGSGLTLAEFLSAQYLQSPARLDRPYIRHSR